MDVPSAEINLQKQENDELRRQYATLQRNYDALQSNYKDMVKRVGIPN